MGGDGRLYQVMLSPGPLVSISSARHSSSYLLPDSNSRTAMMRIATTYQSTTTIPSLFIYSPFRLSTAENPARLATSVPAAIVSSTSVLFNELQSSSSLTKDSSANSYLPTFITDLTFFEVFGFLLIFSIVFFLMLSYTCHMLSVFAPAPVQGTSCCVACVGKLVEYFSSFNTVKSKFYPVSTPTANRKIASASKQIALAMTHLSPTSESISSRPVTWYHSTDNYSNRDKHSLVGKHSFPTVEDCFSTSEIADLGTSSPNSSSQLFRLSSGGKLTNSLQGKLSGQMSNSEVLVEVDAQSKAASVSERETDIISTTHRARSNTTKSQCSQRSKNENVSIAECHYGSFSMRREDEGRLLLIANSNTSTPNSQETIPCELGSNLGELAEVDEDLEVPPMRCRRTSSLPQLSTFLAATTYRQESCNQRIMNSISGEDQESTSTLEGSSALLLPLSSMSATSSPHLNRQHSSNDNWQYQELPGIDNYYKHHGKVNCVSPTSPNMGSPVTSVTDVFKLKQQAFNARTRTKRYKKMKQASASENTSSSMTRLHHGSFISGGHRRLQNLL